MHIWIKAANLLLLLLIMLMPVSASASHTGTHVPSVKGGVLDLSNHSVTSDQLISLSGEWEFYWMKLLTPDELKFSSPLAAEIDAVPHVWGTEGTKTTAREGYATYRLRIVYPEGPIPLQAVYIPAAASAYRLWINGIEQEGNGIVGTDRTSMSPKNYAKVIRFAPRSGENEIVIQVSNFVQRKGGLWAELSLGNDSAVTNKREIAIGTQLFISVALVTMGAYHFFLFFLRRSDRLSLLFSASCMLLALRSLLLGETLLVRFIPNLSWEIMVKLEYLAGFVGTPLVLYYIHRLYPEDTSIKFRNGIIAVSSVFTAVVLLFPARIYTYTLLPFQIILVVTFLYCLYVSIVAALRKREGALLNAAGAVILVAAVLNDVMYYSHMISSVDFAPFGFLIYMFIQTVVIALKFSNAYFRVGQISEELRHVNLTLEERIRERTNELEQGNEHLKQLNDHLKQSEDSRRQLVTNISHELGTPMTYVQGYLKAMLDGVVAPGDTKFIKLIYDKTLVVNRLVQDLFLLSKLEAEKGSFQFIAVPAWQFFHDYVAKFRFDIEKNDIHFHSITEPLDQSEQTAVVQIDIVRMQQVMTNIVHNAVKYTPPGGQITFKGWIQEGDGAQQGQCWFCVKVSDTGKGIAPEVLPYIFNRFYKGKPSDVRDSYESTGLGLAIVKEIIAGHGGTIEADSEHGIGTSFTFKLPAIWMNEKMVKEFQ